MTDLALNHTLWLPYSGQRIGVDNILILDGTILPNQPSSVNDFWPTPKQLGVNITSPDLMGNCGFNYTGYGEFLSSQDLEFNKVSSGKTDRL
jgi:aldose 1-epimerase